MTPLSPEQWRVLDYLYQHKLHATRPKLTHVRKTQKVTDDDLLDLIRRDLVIPLLGDDEIPERAGRLPCILQRAVVSLIRLRLPAAGLRKVLDDPGNQIRYTLDQHDQPISLAKVFDGNSVDLDDVTSQQTQGLIRVELPEIGEFELEGNADGLSFGLGYILRVKLTAKGREYLPY